MEAPREGGGQIDGEGGREGEGVDLSARMRERERGRESVRERGEGRESWQGAEPGCPPGRVSGSAAEAPVRQRLGDDSETTRKGPEVTRRESGQDSVRGARGDEKDSEGTRGGPAENPKMTRKGLGEDPERTLR